MSTPKRTTAAELRRNLAGFEKSLRDRIAQDEQSAADYPSDESLKVFFEGRATAWRGALVSLHIWTDGEFGEAPPTPEGDAQ